MMYGGAPMQQGRDRFDQPPLPMMGMTGPQGGMGLGGMPGMPGMGGFGGMTGFGGMPGMPGMGPMGGMPGMGGMGGGMGKGGKGGLPPMQGQFPQQPQASYGGGLGGGGGGGVGGGGGGPSGGKGKGSYGAGPSGGCKGGGGGGKNQGGGHMGKGGGKNSMNGGMGGGMGGGPAPQSNVPTQMSINGQATWSYGQTSAGPPPAKGAGKEGGKDAGKNGKGAAPEPQQPHSNIFVGNLSEGATKETLEKDFSQYGEIKTTSVMNKNGRTFGFVKFGSVNSAQAAVKSLNNNAQGWVVKFANNDSASGYGKGKDDGKGKGKFFEGKGKGPAPPAKIDHANIYVSGLPEGCTEERLQTVFSPYGKVRGCHIAKRSQQAGKEAEEGSDESYALVEFSTVAEAEGAVKQMDGQAGWTVKFANNDARVGWDAHVPHSNVFVGNLAEDIDKAMLEKVFSQHGTVLSCVLHNEAAGEEGEGKRYGFVKFATTAAAARAIDALEGQNGWSVKPANNDTGGGKGAGYYYYVPDNVYEGWTGGYGGGGGSWAGGNSGYYWVPSSKQNEKPEPSPSDNLYIKDLPPGITEEQVHQTFAKIGPVVECRVLRWDSGSGCAALVRMATQEQATRARAQLNNSVHELCQHPLTLSLQVKGGETVDDHIHVKGVHCTTTKEQLDKLFSKYGTVKWSRLQGLKFPPKTGTPPDITALVQMSTPEEASKAIDGLHGKTSAELGQPMTVRYAESKMGGDSEAKPNNNIYVKGWPVGFPDFLLQSIFQQHGNVLRLRLLENPDPDQPTCAALVQMSRVEEAAVAVRQLHGRPLSVAVPPMHVRFAGRDQGNPDNLYVSGLPRTITESSIRQTFAQYGEIKQLKLLQQSGSYEARALVRLESPQAAARAQRELDGSTPSFKGPTLFVAYAAKREGGNRS
eukprot:CAMPEP_0206496016 /NCGR_PEP_ID=MMETSP0324_2-20121206/49068_1 /ASSEMBLY_ACC=CAM_ASM_000836 /TAXON_ID=2866 /ORGANISM="Crypthecodinium cohnii, Strain Seligo" /LENGTH=916 /DNA_ID=CAMNT_0053980773 /DNA_START=145 /DNA_END=2895 /DNA_ORIENTATION=+